jgi:hypothetical protein
MEQNSNPRWLSNEVIVLVILPMSNQTVIYLHCIIKYCMCISLSHTHCQMDLVGNSIWLDQLDEAKTDLQTARFFELVQIQYS